MADEVERDEAAGLKLLMVFFKNLQKRLTDDFGYGAWHARSRQG